MRKKWFLPALALVALAIVTVMVVLGIKLSTLSSAVTGAVVGAEAAALPVNSERIWKLVFNDSFDRNDSNQLGYGWLELDGAAADEDEEEGDEEGDEEDDDKENDNKSKDDNEGNENDSSAEDLDDRSIEPVIIGNSKSNSQSNAKIKNRRLVFDTDRARNRPLISQALTPRSYGVLNWTFTFNFKQTKKAKDYELWLQLGENSTLASPADSDSHGVAVNLKWGGTKNGFAHEEGFGYAQGNSTAEIAVISGGNASIQVLMSLDHSMFNVSVNGALLASNVPFNQNTAIDALRIYADKIKQDKFALREIDDITIYYTEAVPPRAAILTAAASPLNVSSTLDLIVNATDDSGLDSVLALINYPNQTQMSLPLIFSGLYYNASLTIPNLQGFYNISITANDLFNNINNTARISFLVNSTDADADGIPDEIDMLRGNWQDINSSGVTSLNATIDGQNATGSFSGVKEVQLRDGRNLLVNFSYNFSLGPLDFKKISLLAAADSLIINLGPQFSGSKTLHLPDNNFIGLCVKDVEISSISEISSLCQEAQEMDFTGCIGNSSGITVQNYSCFDEGSVFKITGLRHSGVKGLISAEAPPSSFGDAGGSSGYGAPNSETSSEETAAVESPSETTPAPGLTNLLPPSENEVLPVVDDKPAFSALPTGAIVNPFPSRTLTAYILDAVMIISILIIVFVVVYFAKSSKKNRKTKKARKL